MIYLVYFIGKNCKSARAAGKTTSTGLQTHFVWSFLSIYEQKLWIFEKNKNKESTDNSHNSFWAKVLLSHHIQLATSTTRYSITCVFSRVEVETVSGPYFTRNTGFRTLTSPVLSSSVRVKTKVWSRSYLSKQTKTIDPLAPATMCLTLSFRYLMGVRVSSSILYRSVLPFMSMTHQTNTDPPQNLSCLTML